MCRSYHDVLEKNDCAGLGSASVVYIVSPTIAVKTLWGGYPQPDIHAQRAFTREVEFYKCLNNREDKCPHIAECFLALPTHLFLAYCSLKSLQHRITAHQTRETGADGFPGQLLHVHTHEDPALIARWMIQLTSALAYLEKMGISHNDVHPRNCLLDGAQDLKLTDFDHATPVGRFLESSYAPWARTLPAGPLAGGYGLCGARTEQFAVGTLLYALVFGYTPYEDIGLEDADPAEFDRRFRDMELPVLRRENVFEGLIEACWHNVFPAMTVLASSCRRRMEEDFGSIVDSPGRIGSVTAVVGSSTGRRACEKLVRAGLLGPEIAARFQPAWWKWMCGFAEWMWRRLYGCLTRLGLLGKLAKQL